MSDQIVIKKKICLLGSYGVGKTSLVRRFVYNKFEEKYLSTIGVQISRKTLNYNDNQHLMNTEVNLFLWDIANIEKFDSVVKSYISGAHGAIIVADITRPNSLTPTIDFANNFIDANPDGKVVFVGNKTDLESDIKISEDDFRSKSLLLNSDVFFTSAKSGANVELLFQSFSLKLIGAENSG